MKIALSVLFGTFLIVSAARADSYSTSLGPLYYPDGATITSVTYNPGYPSIPFWELDYSFGDGTGVAGNDGVDGETGAVYFSTPVTSVTIGFVGGSVLEGPFTATFCGLGCGIEETTYSSDDSAGSYTFTGPVTEINWVVGNGEADPGGITSLSYTEESVPVPESGSVGLLAIGLCGVLLLVAPNTARPTPQRIVGK